MNRRQSLVVISSALGALTCRRKQAKPEDRVKELLASLETAIEAGELGPVREALSPWFSGNENMDKPSALAVLQLRLRSSKKLFLLTRFMNVEATPGQGAAAEFLVAMAAVPIAGPEALANMEAEVYRFQLTLTEDAEAPHGYLIKSAAWSPARWTP